jgi:hypothetical protein
MRALPAALAIIALIAFAFVAGRARGEAIRWQRRPDPVTARIIVGSVLVLFAVIALGKLLT